MLSEQSQSLRIKDKRQLLNELASSFLFMTPCSLIGRVGYSVLGSWGNCLTALGMALNLGPNLVQPKPLSHSKYLKYFYGPRLEIVILNSFYYMQRGFITIWFFI